MKKSILVLCLILLLSGCSLFGRYAPTAEVRIPEENQAEVPTKAVVVPQVPVPENNEQEPTGSCSWNLISEIPQAFTASTAPEATSSVEGTTVQTYYDGISTVHSWTHPGTVLIPGDDLYIEVSTSWSVTDELKSSITGGLHTSFIFGVESVKAGRKTINYNVESNGYVTEDAVFTVYSGSAEGATFSMYAFADAAAAGGRVDYKYSYSCEAPTPTVTKTDAATATPTETPLPTPTITPTQKCLEETPEEKLDVILEYYYKTIPKGITSSGKENNILDLMEFPGYGEFVCGGYQQKVLDLLNRLKFHEDPCKSQLLDDWDFGPIQAWGKFHQAVVIYPTGTFWMETGLVLDPWPEQTPKVYPIQEWVVMFAVANMVPNPASEMVENAMGGSYIGIGESEVYAKEAEYPMFGGKYQKAGSPKLTDEENEFVKAKPKEIRDLFWKLDRTEQKIWLKRNMTGDGKVQKAIADCPLDLSIVDANGARSGIYGGVFYDQLPDVYHVSLNLVDGTRYSEIIYPQEPGYTLVLEGTGSGPAYVWTNEILTLDGGEGLAHQYHFDVNQGANYKVPAHLPGAEMIWAGGSLQPEQISNIPLSLIESLPKLQLPMETQATNPTGFSNLSGWARQLDLKIPVWAGVLILLFGLGLFVLFVILLIVRLARSRRAATTPLSSQVRSGGAAIWVLLIGLLVIACLVSSCGVLGLIASQGKQPIVLLADPPEETITETRATQLALGEQDGASEGVDITTLQAVEPLQAGTATQSALTETPTPEPIPTERWGEIFSTSNKSGVSNGASSPEFTLPLQGPLFCKVTKILTYHWNNGNGATPGTIALQGSDGSYYGPYQASGEDGMGGVKNANWVVFVDILIMQQVTYTVIDSDPATWAQNSGTGGVGMTIVWGACSQ